MRTRPFGGDPVSVGPGQGALLEVDGDAAAAPVTAYGGEGVLGSRRLVGVEAEARAADDLAVVEGEEHRVAEPHARPPVEADLEGSVNREVV